MPHGPNYILNSYISCVYSEDAFNMRAHICGQCGGSSVSRTFQSEMCCCFFPFLRIDGEDDWPAFAYTQPSVWSLGFSTKKTSQNLQLRAFEYVECKCWSIKMNGVFARDWIKAISTEHIHSASVYGNNADWCWTRMDLGVIADDTWLLIQCIHLYSAIVSILNRIAPVWIMHTYTHTHKCTHRNMSGKQKSGPAFGWNQFQMHRAACPAFLPTIPFCISAMRLVCACGWVCGYISTCLHVTVVAVQNH